MERSHISMNFFATKKCLCKSGWDRKSVRLRLCSPHDMLWNCVCSNRATGRLRSSKLLDGLQRWIFVQWKEKETNDIHPWRLTWNIIMEVWKMIFLPKWVICRFHVNLPGCTLHETNSKRTWKWMVGFDEIPFGGMAYLEVRTVRSRECRTW